MAEIIRAHFCEPDSTTHESTSLTHGLPFRPEHLKTPRTFNEGKYHAATD
jgi:hypothetical protein